jgi:hypothetical protein
MRRAHVLGLALTALAFALLAAPAPAQSAPSQISRDQILSYARVALAITKARDSIQAALAQTRNKTPEAQKQLQEKLRTQIEEILHHSGMTEADYQRQTYLISTEPERRKMFDDAIAELTGAPTIAQLQARSAEATANAAARGGGGGGGRGGRGGRGGGGGEGQEQQLPLPSGPAGTHLGHVLNGFGDTPNGAGLLPTAMAEARVAAQHAGLASRAATNLGQMKTHAGHIMHAVDPTAGAATGPGQGYGVKKAATAVAAHVELAARAEGAPANVATHSVHIATSARNTAKRVDEIVALCKQVQAATDVAAAAGLVSQIVSLADQLIAGGDANGDGRVGWQEGEGGLQQAQEHLTLMLGGQS